MSGSTASQALHQRFDAIRRAELARLQKKLAGLSDQERHSVDQITSHVIEALARGPARALANDSTTTLSADVLVHLFALDR
jgi:glutamyl-tRNA reductase